MVILTQRDEDTILEHTLVKDQRQLPTRSAGHLQGKKAEHRLGAAPTDSRRCLSKNPQTLVIMTLMLSVVASDDYGVLQSGLQGTISSTSDTLQG
jgi:hypothetical protein